MITRHTTSACYTASAPVMSVPNSNGVAALHSCTKEELLALLCEYELQLQAEEASTSCTPDRNPELIAALASLARDSKHATERQNRLQHVDPSRRGNDLLARINIAPSGDQQVLSVLERRCFELLAEKDALHQRERSNVLRYESLLAHSRDEKDKSWAELEKCEARTRQLEHELFKLHRKLASEQRRARMITLYLIHELNESNRIVRILSEKDKCRRTKDGVHSEVADLSLDERLQMQERITCLEEELTQLGGSPLLSLSKQQSTSTADNIGVIPSNKSDDLRLSGAGIPTSASFPAPRGNTGVRTVKRGKEELLGTGKQITAQLDGPPRLLPTNATSPQVATSNPSQGPLSSPLTRNQPEGITRPVLIDSKRGSASSTLPINKQKTALLNNGARLVEASIPSSSSQSHNGRMPPSQSPVSQPKSSSPFSSENKPSTNSGKFPCASNPASLSQNSFSPAVTNNIVKNSGSGSNAPRSNSGPHSVFIKKMPFLSRKK